MTLVEQSGSRVDHSLVADIGVVHFHGNSTALEIIR